MEKLAPLLSKISMPVDRQGNINPQALTQMLAQVLVAQRFIQVQMDLEVFKLTTMFKFLAANPLPNIQLDTVNLQEVSKWGEDLCKYLHLRLEEYTQNIVNSLQESQKQEQSKILVPGSNVRQGMVRPA